MSVGGYVHTSASTHGGQKRASKPLELELQVAMSQLRWVLGFTWVLSKSSTPLNHTAC